MKALVVSAIQDLGVQVEFIPPGCTSLFQPVDVGYSRAFTAKLRMEYNTWLLEQDPDLLIPTTTCRDVANWIITTERNISTETLKNLWNNMGYSYFGVFDGNGKFVGEDVIVSDEPNKPLNAVNAMIDEPDTDDDTVEYNEVML